MRMRLTDDSCLHIRSRQSQYSCSNAQYFRKEDASPQRTPMDAIPMASLIFGLQLCVSTVNVPDTSGSGRGQLQSCDYPQQMGRW